MTEQTKAMEIWREACEAAILDKYAIHLQSSKAAAAVITRHLPQPSLQSRVEPWIQACFGAEIASDTLERTDRFIEEALELAQTNPAFTADRAHALVSYVFGRPVGDPAQEVGGVMITLAALCLANGLDMHEAGETELARIWTKVDVIRAKQAAKPTGSALPIPQPSGDGLVERFAEPWDGMLSPIVLCHQLLSSAAIQDKQTKRETGWADTSDRAELMRKASTHITNLEAELASLRADRDRLAGAVLAVVAATRAYLPPDGISAHECLNRIIGATDNPEINPIISEIENGPV